MLCVFKKILWYNTFDDYLNVIIFSALVLSTFWIWKVNGSFIH